MAFAVFRDVLVLPSGLLTFRGIGESKSPFRLVFEPVVLIRGSVFGVSSSSLETVVNIKT